MVLTGWVSPELGDPIAPIPENIPLLQVQPQPTRVHPARTMNEEAMRPSNMPLPPTDPRAYSRTELPLPPTMNGSGMLPTTGRIGLGPRLVNPAGLADNGGRRLPPQKPFETYRPSPSVSPYALLNANTDNGTVNPYMSYVRPAEEQQQVSQELDRAASNTGIPANQPAPYYPPVFQNYGSYYPAVR